jgi:hypothetical protein
MVERCFVIDLIASKLDSAFLEMLHRYQPGDSPNTIGSVSARIDRALDLLGLDAPQRDEKISGWSRVAAFAYNEISDR